MPSQEAADEAAAATLMHSAPAASSSSTLWISPPVANDPFPEVDKSDLLTADSSKPDRGSRQEETSADGAVYSSPAEGIDLAPADSLDSQRPHSAPILPGAAVRSAPASSSVASQPALTSMQASGASAAASPPTPPAPPGPSMTTATPTTTSAAATAKALPTRDVSHYSAPRDSRRGGARPRPRPRLYVDDAARHFGQPFAHRLRWMHAVNSRRCLEQALRSDAHMLEGDVSMGPLVVPAAGAAPGAQQLSDSPSTSPDKQAPGSSPSVSSSSASGPSVIMAHYPTERSSDLSLAQFVDRVLSHNDACEDETDDPLSGSCGHKSTSSTAPAPSDDPEDQEDEEALTVAEAKDFAALLEQEFDATTKVLMPALCLGPRKATPALSSTHRRFGWKKGIKLDFKHFACVEPTVAYLRQVNAAERLQGHLWLNADILVGPGALMTPLDAQKFVRLCAEQLPEAVLSLGWGTTFMSTTRLYTSEMVDRMTELCMTPLVRLPPPWDTPSPCADNQGAGGNQETRGGSSGSGSRTNHTPEDEDGGYRAPLAAVCKHLTFAVAAEYALASAPNLKRLLEYLPSASLTIYTGVGSLSVGTATVQEFVKTFGVRRCFFDLKIARPWRWTLGLCGGSRNPAPFPLTNGGTSTPALADAPSVEAARSGRGRVPAGANHQQRQQSHEQTSTPASASPSAMPTAIPTDASLPASALAVGGAHSAAGNPRLMRPAGKQSKPKSEASQEEPRLISIV